MTYEKCLALSLVCGALLSVYGALLGVHRAQRALSHGRVDD